MARYAYDVNTTQRYIDVHKQFQGGLKTVDTDDALGAVFLREAENVSISEFGFLEKRYGTYENFKRDMPTSLTHLQGYWEFENYKIYAINNRFFVNNESGYREIEKEKENEWRYPTLPAYPFEVVRKDGETKDTYRDMNAVNINRVLYIFTGFYPIYAKVVSGVLKFYWFSIDIPTYDEIVVTGHNLLEDNYEGLYFSETSTLPIQRSSYDSGLEYPKIKASQVVPTLANKQDPIKFLFNTQYPPGMDSWTPQSSKNYFEINLESVSYRTAGFGASTLDFLPANILDTNFQKKSNYSGTNPVSTRGDVFFSQQRFSKVDVKNIISGIGQRRNEYQITLNFEISKDNFLKNNKYVIDMYRFKGDLGYVPFYLINFEGETLRFASQSNLKITPIDYNGNVLKKQAYKVSLLSNNKDSFEVPNNTLLNQSSDIEKYAFELFTQTYEAFDVDIGADGPFDLETNPENYYFDVVAISEKQPAILGNIISASSVPSLNFSLNNLLSGRYDFMVKFVREEWRSVLSNGQFQYLELLQREFFETIITNVIITEEKIQDFPRKDADSIGIQYPTLKPIWTCNKVTEHFGKLMVWGSTAMPTAVFYSFPDRPTYFPSKFFLDFTNDQNSPVEAVSSYMNILVVQTRDQTWGIRGNSGVLTAPAPYAPFTINPTVGTIAYKSVRAVRNHLFFLSKQGIIALKSLYAADEQYNIEFVDRNILNIVPRDDDSAVGIQFDNQYWLNFPKQRITLRWYIDKKAWVKDTYGVWNQFNGVFKYQIVDGKLEFITQPSLFEGENLGVYKVGVDYSLPTDLGGDIVALFETAFLNQNYPFHPKNYKETKMDFTIQNEYNSGRDPIYTMETDEDIHENESLHTIPAPKLLKNHRYQLKYDFQDLNVEILDLGSFEDVQGGFFTDTLTETLNGGLFIQVFTSSVDGGTFVQIDINAGSFNDTASENIDAGYFERILFLKLGEKTIQTTFTNTSTLEFLLDNSDIPAGTDLVATGIFQDYNGGANLLDVTYDHVLDFRTWIISEDNTLNLDNMEGYDQSKALIPIQMGAKFGDWVFGLSDLGNKVTAIKTIKLAGRGYNVKVYFEDYSKSKWTLESLGITYKMKRPRSR